MIEFKNVSKVYSNGTKALNNVNLKIEKGEFVFVVGASGAGKSTFLKLMMREEVPTSGSIKIKDYDLVNMKKRQIPYFRRNMGIVFQDFRLIPTMDVYNNVAFAMRVVSARKKEIRKRVPYVISLVGLASKARCMPNELSGGEQQRVALARALANNAEIIIADEPTGNVDPQMSLEIVELLTRLNDHGTTIIMVTHAHDLVKQFDKRVIVLESGQVVSDGNVENNTLPEGSSGHIPAAAEVKKGGFRRTHGFRKSESVFEQEDLKSPVDPDKYKKYTEETPAYADEDETEITYDEEVPAESAAENDTQIIAQEETAPEAPVEDENITGESSASDTDEQPAEKSEEEQAQDIGSFLDSILEENENYKIYLDPSEKGGDEQ
ncbi:MAG: cell division ATP-binding protein FtsE [Clostridia bacterium]|nr:cell division ATP-binding protein FtsE [Clostridia bacterium]